MANTWGQSELGSVLINEFNDTPEAMAAVIGKYLESSRDVLLHGDIDPLFEDVVVVLLRWIEEDRADLVRDFLGRLQRLLLSHPGYKPPNPSLTSEHHILSKFGTLANILGVALRITLNPIPKPRKHRKR